jgi:hypothetical protein
MQWLPQTRHHCLTSLYSIVSSKVHAKLRTKARERLNGVHSFRLHPDRCRLAVDETISPFYTDTNILTTTGVSMRSKERVGCQKILNSAMTLRLVRMASTSSIGTAPKISSSLTMITSATSAWGSSIRVHRQTILTRQKFIVLKSPSRPSRSSKISSSLFAKNGSLPMILAAVAMSSVRRFEATGRNFEFFA